MLKKRCKQNFMMFYKNQTGTIKITILYHYQTILLYTLFFKQHSSFHNLYQVLPFHWQFIAEGTDNIGAAKLLLLEVGRQDIVDGLEYMNDYQLLLQQVLQTEAQQTFRPSSYSGM